MMKVNVQQEIRAVAESLMADGEHYNIYNTVKKKKVKQC